MKKFLYYWLFMFSWMVSNDIIKEKPIVVVVPSFNNKDWYLKNLDSIFSQKYSNFQLIYIDDCSDDGTAQLVEEYIINNHYESRCTLIKNEARLGPLYNRYRAIHLSPDDAIIVLIDGDDWLAHDNVLSYLNSVYTNEDIFMTVGNACKSSTGNKIGHRDYTKDEWDIFGVRQLGFRGFHPRTFYAWLFKKIKLEDLFEGEKFYPMATDVACLLPMFEMAQGHYKYISDILYVYNDQNPLMMARQSFQTQIYCDMMIRNRSSYVQLLPHECGSSIKNIPYDLSGIAFLTGAHETYPFIQNCKNNAQDFNTFVVIGTQSHNPEIFSPISNSVEFLSLACDLQTIYSLRINIKDRLKMFVEKMNSEYIIIMADDALQDTSINFDTLCTALKNTQAHSLVIGRNPSEIVSSYYQYYKDETSAISIIRPWMFSQSFSSKDGCIGILIHKDTLLQMLEASTVFYPNFSTFLAAWHSLVPMSSVLLMNF